MQAILESADAISGKSVHILEHIFSARQIIPFVYVAFFLGDQA
jgi:hypothetical protein